MAKKAQARRRRAPAIEDLRRRLQEAEDTITAIREGHVEALVVQGADGEQIYTLRSADQPYRLMVEQMREGALTLAADGTILYCNHRFAELVAHAPERVTGRGIADFLSHDDELKLRTMLVAESFRDEVTLRSGLGAENPAQISSIALTIDGIRTVAVVVTDLTH